MAVISDVAIACNVWAWFTSMIYVNQIIKQSKNLESATVSPIERQEGKSEKRQKQPTEEISGKSKESPGKDEVLR